MSIEIAKETKKELENCVTFGTLVLVFDEISSPLLTIYIWDTYNEKKKRFSQKSLYHKCIWFFLAVICRFF